jgi:hypothetical protein
MNRTALFFMALALINPAAFAQSDPPDSRVTQTILSEIRQLRLDLQLAAATIQRVQIAMYRVQSETGLLERASERMESARAMCNQEQLQRKFAIDRLEQAEARQRNAQTPTDRDNSAAMVSQMKSSLEDSAGLEQQCQSEQIDAETQFRTEQAKMNDFQDQLNKLDATLAAYGGK